MTIKEQILAKLNEKKTEDDEQNKYDFDKGAKTADKKHQKFRKDMEKKATKTKEGGVKVTRYPPQDAKPLRPHKGK